MAFLSGQVASLVVLVFASLVIAILSSASIRMSSASVEAELRRLHDAVDAVDRTCSLANSSAQPEDVEFSLERNTKDFFDLALQAKTDKFSWKSGVGHRYECAYGKYLPPLRHRFLKLLEIGLGCGMQNGPGMSVEFWRAYLLNVSIVVLEYNETCSRDWQSQHQGEAELVIGNQEDETMLRQLIARYGPFDIVIDDGGHLMSQQMTSFRVLFPAVQPGGVYFLEDLATSFLSTAGGTANGRGATTANMLTDLLMDMFGERGTWRRVSRIDCCDQICVLQQWTQYEQAYLLSRH